MTKEHQCDLTKQIEKLLKEFLESKTISPERKAAVVRNLLAIAMEDEKV